MTNYELSIRTQTLEDIELIVDYFFNADTNFLLKMGVDTTKLPKKEVWLKNLNENFCLRNDEKSLFYIVWLLNNKPVGHCNINKIKVNEEAYMHLHLWQHNTREKGLGLSFLKLTIPIFFQEYKLRNLFCEPYSLNPAPNKILKKFGFEFICNYETTPGIINFHQPVNKWCLTKQKLELWNF